VGQAGEDRTYERPPPKGNAELFNPKNQSKKQAAPSVNGGGQVSAPVPTSTLGDAEELSDMMNELKVQENGETL
jgi:hypothetical protein